MRFNVVAAGLALSGSLFLGLPDGHAGRRGAARAKAIRALTTRGGSRLKGVRISKESVEVSARHAKGKGTTHSMFLRTGKKKVGGRSLITSVEYANGTVVEHNALLPGQKRVYITFKDAPDLWEVMVSLYPSEDIIVHELGAEYNPITGDLFVRESSYESERLVKVKPGLSGFELYQAIKPTTAAFRDPVALKDGATSGQGIRIQRADSFDFTTDAPNSPSE